MKRILSLAIVFSLVLLGCSDTDQNPSGPNSNGSIDPTVYVAIGNSLTAGYQSGYLTEASQMYSYPNLIAKQFNVNFVQPLIPAPGTGAAISLTSMNPPTLVTGLNNLTAPSNMAHPAPYNNLGIPGSILYDALDTADITPKSINRGNPFFKLVLRDQVGFGKSIIEQALKLKPTLITFWLGNNDALGFATSGGTSPAAPTQSAMFDGLVSNALTALRNGAPDASIVIANIPDVRTIPFFLTVGPQVAPVLLANGGLSIYYQRHGNKGPAILTDTTNLMRQQNVLLTLKGGAYAPLIGKPTGQWYRDLAAMLGVPVQTVISLGIDTTKPFGVYPTNPWPDALVLDIEEQSTCATAIKAYNESILSAVNRLSKPGKPIALVDINSAFNTIAAQGYSLAGEALTIDFIKGGMFSLDGVHPSSKGHGIVANLFIDAMNKTFGANIPKVHLANIPGIAVPMGKRGLPSITSWNIGPDVFNHAIRLFQQ